MHTFDYLAQTEIKQNVILENTAVEVGIHEVHSSILSKVMYEFARIVQFEPYGNVALRTVLYFYIGLFNSYANNVFLTAILEE